MVSVCVEDCRTHLLPVVGGVGQQRRHMEHELIVLVGGVERVCSC